MPRFYFFFVPRLFISSCCAQHVPGRREVASKQASKQASREVRFVSVKEIFPLFLSFFPQNLMHNSQLNWECRRQGKKDSLVRILMEWYKNNRCNYLRSETKKICHAIYSVLKGLLFRTVAKNTFERAQRKYGRIKAEHSKEYINFI